MRNFKKSITILLLFFSVMTTAQYYTGQKVFSNKFPAEIKDYSQDTYIQIKNTEGDIIVAVENVSSGDVIQHAYIKSYDTYKFEHIAVGIYVCKYMWTDRNGEKHFAKDDSTMLFKLDEYGGYEITLTKSESGNLSQSNISESDFFK